MTEEITKCPKCGGKLDSRGCGEYYYGMYEFHEWFCTKCGYSEQEYYYDESGVEED